MKFQEKIVKTKDNKEILIREAKLEDAENLIKTAKKYISTSEHILLTEKDFNPTIEQEEAWINSFISNKNNLLLLASYKNEIIGNIEITASKREKIAHTACLGMSIIKEYRNLGIGYHLLTSMITWAKNNPNLKKIWLEVFATNSNAIALYKKVGFIQEGIRTDFIKIDENTYVDDIIMAIKV